jgi:hypothetical protein
MSSDHLVCREVRPLWTVCGAMAWLRANQEVVLHMIEDGRLEWAWDIAAPRACRREIRIWFRSLERGKIWLTQATASPLKPMPWTCEQVATAIIGHARPVIRGAEAQTILNCDRNLIAKHLAARELVMVGLRGVVGNRTPLILRQSLVEFLRRRRIQ